MAVVNREYIEKIIYDTFNALDTSGIHNQKYLHSTILSHIVPLQIYILILE